MKNNLGVVYSGRSMRFFQVTQMICCGFTARQVGGKLGISERTVRLYIEQAKKIMGARNLAQLGALMVANELLYMGSDGRAHERADLAGKLAWIDRAGEVWDAAKKKTG